MPMKNTVQSLGFRVKPDGPVIYIASRKRQLLAVARYLIANRKLGRLVTTLEMQHETGIQEVKARLCELRGLGFAVETVDQANPAKGDRRKLFGLSADIEIIEGGSNGGLPG
jgi:hypothetical protein